MSTLYDDAACTTCAAPAAHVCGACGAPYCSTACQRADWSVHGALPPVGASLANVGAEPAQLGALFSKKSSGTPAEKTIKAALGMVVTASTTPQCDLRRIANAPYFLDGRHRATLDLLRSAFDPLLSTSRTKPSATFIKFVQKAMNAAQDTTIYRHAFRSNTTTSVLIMLVNAFDEDARAGANPAEWLVHMRAAMRARSDLNDAYGSLMGPLHDMLTALVFNCAVNGGANCPSKVPDCSA